MTRAVRVTIAAGHARSRQAIQPVDEGRPWKTGRER